MSITAFFKSQQAELSLAQYLHVFGFDYKSCQEITDLPQELRQQLSSDAYCPICGCSGAIFVAASIGANKSQAHLKFIDSLGKNAHLDVCNYAEPNENLKLLKSLELSNRNSSSALTRQVDQLVSKAISSGLLSQDDIIGFRRWMLNGIGQKAPSFDVDPKEIRAFMTLSWKVALANAPFNNPKTKKGKDRLAGDKACVEILSGRHPELLQALQSANRKILLNKSTEGLRAYMQKNLNVLRPAPEYLENAWNVTEQLIGKIVSKDQRFKLTSDKDKRFFEAFVCLILYSQSWDAELALSFLDKILTLPDLEVPVQGSIIGFTPFGYYLIDAMLAEINKHAGVIEAIDNFETLWDDIRSALR